MKKDDDFEATEEDIKPVVAKKPNASQHVLKRLSAKPSLHLKADMEEDNGDMYSMA